LSLLSARDLWVAPPAEGAHGEAAPEAIVRGFSLDVDRGEWIALSGPNGCGKTSLLLALAGLWPARTGTLILEGRPFGPDSPRRSRAEVAVILQDPSCQLLQPTVGEELAFTALNLGQAPDEVARQVEEWGARLGLAAERRCDPQRLSAGRQQLVLLAAALIARPRLLLADEPAAHLDAAARRLVIEVVRDEVARGLAAVWVTQDADERAAASRAVDLVGPGQDGTPPGVYGENEAPPGSADRTLLTLCVSPWDGTDGPAVRTARPLEIPVPLRGITALEGPNAVGKSVLLGIAAGLLRSPQVEVRGSPDPGLPPSLASQYPELEIFEEEAGDEAVYAAVSRGVSRRTALGEATRLLERLGVEPAAFLRRRTWSLSGGEKRLLSLAAALIAPTSLLVLDEPTAGLDLRRRASLAAIVGEAARTTAVLLASQDREWLDRLPAARHRVG